MRNYLCKWPNGDVVLISARDRQQVREILDEQADPGSCQIVRMKGAFAIEFVPKVPKRPRDESNYENHMCGFGDEEYEAPADPLERPQVMRWIGPGGTTVDADLFQEFGGKLSAKEAAAVKRWKQATKQQQGGAAAAAAEEPWVTEEQLKATGMLDEPYHVQVDYSRTEYGRYTSRLMKRITKHFFPKTQQALKVLAEEDGAPKAAAVRNLRAAVAADVWDKQQDEEANRKHAKLMADACNGDRNAMTQFVMDQTTNVFGREAADDEDTSSYEYDSGSDSDGDMGVLSMVRRAQMQGVAAALGTGGGGGGRAARGPGGRAARDEDDDSDKAEEEEEEEEEGDDDGDDDDERGGGHAPKRRQRAKPAATKAGKQPAKKQRGEAAAAAAAPVSKRGRGRQRK